VSVSPASTSTGRPWYREPWMWLVAGVPAATVVGGLVTLFLAASGDDAIVRDDFRKEGLAIYADPRRDAAAAAAGARATLTVDGSAGTIDVRLTLERGEPPRELLVLLSHATRARNDRMLRLERRGAGYGAALEPLADGHWYVELTPPDRGWRLRGEFRGAAAVVELGAAGPR